MKIIISENQFKVLSETITLDINVGDTDNNIKKGGTLSPQFYSFIIYSVK